MGGLRGERRGVKARRRGPAHSLDGFGVGVFGRARRGAGTESVGGSANGHFAGTESVGHSPRAREGGSGGWRIRFRKNETNDVEYALVIGDRES